jgi:hypothetical protein
MATGTGAARNLSWQEMIRNMIYFFPSDWMRQAKPKLYLCHPWPKTDILTQIYTCDAIR